MIRVEKLLPFAGRVLISGIFLSAAWAKLQQPKATSDYMASKKIPLVQLARPLAAAAEITGSLSLMSGFKGRYGALLLIAFLIPTSLTFHDFWNLEGEEKEMQAINFFKNLAIIGGLLQFVRHGSGRISVDSLIEARSGRVGKDQVIRRPERRIAA